MQSKKEQLLLFRIRQTGDRKAFEEIYRMHQGSVRRFLSIKLPRPEDVEDALSLVFERTWNYLCSAPVEHLSGLIFTIARGAIANFYRDRPQATLPLHDIGTDVSQASDEGSEMRAIENRAELELVLKALERLSEREREFVTLRHLQGMTTREMARHFQMTEGSVSVALHRAMQRLREVISENGYE